MPVDLAMLRATRARLGAQLDDARARLRFATDPATIEQCLVDEAVASIELELLADQTVHVSPALLAASVWLGDLQIEDAIEFVSMMPDSERTVALTDLAAVLDARGWLEMVRLRPDARSLWWVWMSGARSRGAFEDIVAVCDADESVTGEMVGYVFDRWGAAAAARFAALARATLARRDLAGGEGAEDDALLLLALPADEALPRALDWAQWIDELYDDEVYFDEGYDELDPRAAVVIALSFVGELARANALFERMLSRPRPWVSADVAPVLTESVRRAARALCAASSPEQRAAIQQRLFEWLDLRATSDANVLAEACVVLDEPWAGRAAERLAAMFESATSKTSKISSDVELITLRATHPKALAASVACKREALVASMSKSETTRQDQSLAQRVLDALPHEDEGVVSFVIEHHTALSRLLSGGASSKRDDLQWLRVAASEGSPLALAWLEAKIHERTVRWEAPQLYVKLPKQLVRRIFDQAEAGELTTNRRRDWALLAMSFARGVGDRERAVVCASHREACEALPAMRVELAAVIARDEQRAFVRAHVPQAFRSTYDVRSLLEALDDPEARREVFEAAVEHFSVDQPFGRFDWIDASVAAFVSEECASRALDRVFAGREIPLSAMHPETLLRASRSADVESDLRWATLLQSRAVLSAIGSIAEGAHALQRCAGALFRGWNARGSSVYDSAWQALYELVAHVSREDAIEWATHPWPLDAVSFAHALSLALYVYRGDPAVDRALASLVARFEAAVDRGWYRAVRTYISPTNTQSVEEVFRSCAADAAKTRVERDAVVLGIVDALLPLGVDMPSDAALAWAAQLVPHARSEAIDRARPWIERAIRASGERGFERFREHIARLGRDTIVHCWVTTESRTKPSVVLGRPWALAALGGQRVIERIAPLAARALEQCGARSLGDVG